jgi:cytochrome c oxidase assembly factor CtaG
MINIERKSLGGTQSDFHHPSSRATRKAMQYLKAIMRTIFKSHPWSWIFTAGSLIFVWYIPQIFDYAFTHNYVHVIQHFSFIIIGATTVIVIRLLGESFNLLLIFSLICMMSISGLILVISDNQIYQLTPSVTIIMRVFT